jgi:hypothetical protein
MAGLFNRFVSAGAAAAGIVLFVTRKMATRSVSPYLERAYNGIACRTEGAQSRQCRAETFKEFPRWAFVCADTLTFDNLCSERHGVRKDKPVLLCFS